MTISEQAAQTKKTLVGWLRQTVQGMLAERTPLAPSSSLSKVACALAAAMLFR